jgi:hypothetical protein
MQVGNSRVQNKAHPGIRLSASRQGSLEKEICLGIVATEPCAIEQAAEKVFSAPENHLSG